MANSKDKRGFLSLAQKTMAVISASISNRKDANGDVITTKGSSCRTTSYTICAGNEMAD